MTDAVARDGEGTFSEINDPKFLRVGICHTCRHRTSGRNCRAFTEGIPLDILVGNVLHTRPVIGDNGIQYEAKVI